MNDFFLDLLNLLKVRGVVTAQEHKQLLLTGYEKLDEHLANNKIITSADARGAMKNGYTSLVNSLAK